MAAKLSVGFTGTQQGMTSQQLETLGKILNNLKADILNVHHGDCIGSDEEFHLMSQKLALPVVGHPPLKNDKRAFCAGFTEVRPRKDYLVRNKDIVDESDVLIAAPRLPKEELRSGTWATVRYARRIKKRTIVIFPDGKTENK